MFGVVLPDHLYIFLTKSSPKPFVSKIIQPLPNLSNLSLIVVVWLQICPFSIDIFMDIAQWKSRVLFLIPGSMFDPQDALVNHTLSKSYYPIHELFLTNPLSFQELVNFGTTYLPLPFLNPTTYLPSNLTSTNWISSPYLINFPFSFSLVRALL